MAQEMNSPISMLRLGGFSNDSKDANAPFFEETKNIRVKTDVLTKQIRVLATATLIARNGTLLLPPGETPRIPELQDLIQYVLELSISRNRLSRQEWQIIQSAIKSSVAQSQSAAKVP